MIKVDNRVGSKELAKMIKKSRLCRMEFGDFSFSGCGPDDAKVTIGIERKSVTDLIACCYTGRFAGHQLPGMSDMYDYNYLVVEGVWRIHSKSKRMETYRGNRWKETTPQMHGDGFTGFINSIGVIAGWQIRHTNGAVATAALIESLYKWWQKGYEKHRSHMAIKHPALPTANLHFGKASVLRRVLSELPGIGVERSAAAAKEFSSILDMVWAGEERWLNIPGVGPRIARAVMSSLQEER